MSWLDVAILFGGMWLGLLWLGCPILGALIGSGKRGAWAGFLIGLIFGPLGVLAAFAIDQRLRCPRCLSRLEGRAQVCPFCHIALDWSVIGAAQEAASAAEKQQQIEEGRQRRADATAGIRQRRAERERRRNEEIARLSQQASGGGGPLAIPRRIDEALAAIAGEGNVILHQFLRILAALGALGAVTLGLIWLF